MIAFRDNDFTSSVYIALRVDADSVHSVVDMSRVNYFELRGAFFDDEWMVDKRFAETLWASSVPTGMRSGRNAYELVRSVQMPFDYYHFTCTFADEYEITRAQFRADGETYRYAGDDLTVSDILLQSPDGTGTPIERRGFTLYPHPGHVYHQGERLTVYFEVYGLSVIRQSSDYQVSFSIYEAPDEPAPTWLRWSRRIGQAVGIGDEEPTISQTIERAGPDHEAQEEIRINVDSLREGRYQLVIDVFDRVSGDTSEAITVVFEKVGTLVRASR
ncbi:MAG: hypothetical protein IH969_09525 [Candidatus Krumholzibacteriota bacterium]|nr:hypothetical protein [Candidatus Krumholzibacteriota bacterium]